MEEKKFVDFKKEALGVREYIKGNLGKGKISDIEIEYTPIGEKIKVHTSRPGLVIGRKGERIEELTTTLKRRFKLENPHIEIIEITDPMLDAKLIADEIAISLERKGSLKFKVIAYRTLQQIVRSGAMGVEIVLSGKLPSDRARTWRFTHGYLKKTGDPAKLVDRAYSQAKTLQGVVGIQVSLLKPNTNFKDKVHIDENILHQIRINAKELSPQEEPEEEKPKQATEKKTPEKKTIKKTTKKSNKKIH